MAAQTQRRRTPDAVPAAAPKAPTPAPEARPKAPPPPPAGLYGDLGVRNETAEFGALGSGERSGDVRGIVEHRTESPTMESARNSYRTQIEAGRHVGAHYLIGADGATSLTVPTDQNTAHVRGNRDAAWKGANAWSIGIENVGMPTKIDPKGDIRKQVEALTLSPAMRTRLLAMDDATLKSTLKGDGNEVHTDISGPQKRANWNLVNQLCTTHSLDPATQVVGHESVDHKTLGEGEPIIEFMTVMRQWPAKVQAAEARIDAMARDPAVTPEEIAAARRVLAEEQAAMEAVRVDKTAQENTQLAGEEVLGEGGPATTRETTRTRFYDQFWQRTQRIDQLGVRK